MTPIRRAHSEMEAVDQRRRSLPDAPGPAVELSCHRYINLRHLAYVGVKRRR